MPSISEIAQEINQSTDWAGMRTVGRALAPSVLPTAGAAAMTPFLGPWAGPVVGGMAGEAGNNLIGLTEPSVYSYAAQALVPPALRTGVNAGKLWPKFGTSARGAETLQDVGRQDIRLMQQQYQPKTPSKPLFDMVGKEIVPMPGARQASGEVLARIESQLPSDRPLYAKSGSAAHDIEDLFKTERVVTPESDLYPEDLGRYTVQTRPSAGGLAANRFQEAMSTAGQRLRAAKRGEESVGGSTNVRNFSTLYGGYARDLDASPILKQARQSFKREQTLEDMGEAAKIFTPKGHGEAEQINVNRLMGQLKDNQEELGKFFSQAFSAQEQNAILRRLGKINELPGLGPGTGQATGSSKVNPVLAAMLGTGGMAYTHGGAGEAALAAAGTYGLSASSRMLRDIGIAWNIPAGRAMIQEMTRKSGGKFTPEIRAAVEAFAASQTANLPQTRAIIQEGR